MTDPFRQRIDAAASTLPRATLRVARFIDANRATALASSAFQIAANTRTSDATVVRTARALGFNSLGDLKRALAESMERPSSTPAEDMRRTLQELGEGTERAIDMVIEAQRDGVNALETPESRARMTAAVTLLHPADRIAIFGIGPSAALVRYAAVPLGRAGRRTLLLDRTGRTLADELLELRHGDALLILTYGRPYREVIAVFAEARRLGLPTVLITDDYDHGLGAQADVLLIVPRGRAGRVALHGATLIAIEALVLGLTAAVGDRALATLERFNVLRAAVGEPRRKAV